MASGAIVNNDPTLGPGKKDRLSLLLALQVQREHLCSWSLNWWCPPPCNVDDALYNMGCIRIVVTVVILVHRSCHHIGFDEFRA